MSLGAKELFHTNFIGFLLESDDEQLEGVRCAIRESLNFPIRTGERSRCFVWREKKNLDLVLVPVASSGDPEQADEPVRNRALVVEAKLKSTPSWEQLNRYSQEALKSLRLDDGAKPNSFRITLSTQGSKHGIKPELRLLAPTDEKIHADWLPASWSTLHNKLDCAVTLIPHDSPFAYILRDYADSLRALISIIKTTRDYVRKTYTSCEITYGMYESALTHSELRKLRLHDMVGKLANDEWARRLTSLLAKELDQESVKRVVPYVLFSNSQPGLGLEISAHNGFYIGIQIQGGQFRRYIRNIRDRADIEQRTRHDKLWTGWFMQIVAGTPLSGPVKRASSKLTGLRCFGAKRFLYSAMDLRPINWKTTEDATVESVRKALEIASDTELWI